MERSIIPFEIVYRHGANLPHWTAVDATYHVVFRLADSLPAHVVAALRNERDLLREQRRSGRIDDRAYRAKLELFFSQRIEAILDQGEGSCWLKNPKVAEIIANALVHFRGERYELIAAALMPNHGHAVVMPLRGHNLSEILKSWKGYTARIANRILGRSGGFWQKESYDHLIRDEAEYRHTVNYVMQNPNKAGLRDWPWVWDGEKWGEYPRVFDR